MLFLLCLFFHFWFLRFDSFLSWWMALWGHCLPGRLRESLHVWGCLSLDPYVNDIVTMYRILRNCCSSKFNRHCFIVEFSYINQVCGKSTFFFVTCFLPISILKCLPFFLETWNFTKIYCKYAQSLCIHFTL